MSDVIVTCALAFAHPLLFMAHHSLSGSLERVRTRGALSHSRQSCEYGCQWVTSPVFAYYFEIHKFFFSFFLNLCSHNFRVFKTSPRLNCYCDLFAIGFICVSCEFSFRSILLSGVLINFSPKCGTTCGFSYVVDYSYSHKVKSFYYFCI